MTEKLIMDEAKDVLVPLQTEEKELAPYPKIEYDVLTHYKLDKLIRDVNKKMEQGRQTEWGIQVSTWGSTMYYQAMVRWNVDLEEDRERQDVDLGEDKVIHIPGLEDEPNLYEDMI